MTSQISIFASVNCILAILVFIRTSDGWIQVNINHQNLFSCDRLWSKDNAVLMASDVILSSYAYINASTKHFKDKDAMSGLI